MPKPSAKTSPAPRDDRGELRIKFAPHELSIIRQAADKDRRRPTEWAKLLILDTARATTHSVLPPTPRKKGE